MLLVKAGSKTNQDSKWQRNNSVTSCKVMCIQRWEESTTIILQYTQFTSNHVTWGMNEKLGIVSLQCSTGAMVITFGHLKYCNGEEVLCFLFIDAVSQVKNIHKSFREPTSVQYMEEFFKNCEMFCCRKALAICKITICWRYGRRDVCIEWPKATFSCLFQCWIPKCLYNLYRA